MVAFSPRFISLNVLLQHTPRTFDRAVRYFTVIRRAIVLRHDRNDPLSYTALLNTRINHKTVCRFPGRCTRIDSRARFSGSRCYKPPPLFAGITSRPELVTVVRKCCALVGCRRSSVAISGFPSDIYTQRQSR